MKFIKVESSNLAALGYDAPTNVLGVLFKANTLYFYTGVPGRVWAEFQKAESLGKFFNTNVKPHYNYFQVEGLKPVDGDSIVDVLEPVVPVSDGSAVEPPSLELEAQGV